MWAVRGAGPAAGNNFFSPFPSFLSGTVLKSINDFLFQSQIDNINLFKVMQILSVRAQVVVTCLRLFGVCVRAGSRAKAHTAESAF